MILVQQIRLPLPTNTREAKGMRMGVGVGASLRYSATVFQLAGANSGPRNLSYQFLLGGPEGKGISRLQ